jgi:hypothetical protein
MKKNTFIALIGTALILSACGGGSTTSNNTDSINVKTDSIAKQVDTAAITAKDSTVSKIPEDGGKGNSTQPLK